LFKNIGKLRVKFDLIPEISDETGKILFICGNFIFNESHTAFSI